MNGQEILGNVAFYVSIVVVIGMAIMFSVLFSIYGYYKIKSVYSTSNHYPHFGDLTALPVFVPSCGAEATLVSNQFISVPSYTDTSPPQEVLCTFRC